MPRQYRHFGKIVSVFWPRRKIHNALCLAQKNHATFLAGTGFGPFFTGVTDKNGVVCDPNTQRDEDNAFHTSSLATKTITKHCLKEQFFRLNTFLIVFFTKWS